jgi:hypothetical protein
MVLPELYHASTTALCFTPTIVLKLADVLDLSVQRQKMAVQVVRLAKVLQVVRKYAIACGSGPAGSFSLVCVRTASCVHMHARRLGVGKMGMGRT